MSRQLETIRERIEDVEREIDALELETGPMDPRFARLYNLLDDLELELRRLEGETE